MRRGPITSPQLAAALRFYLREAWHSAGRAMSRSNGRTWAVRRGPVEVSGYQLVLRSPRLDDAAQWCAVRLREREAIERWWVSSPLNWAERHTEAQWICHVLQTRRDARAGRALPLVIEIDGKLAGECNLESIDAVAGTAELGVWMDSRWARKGLTVVALGLLIDYTMGELGLHRITAPICEGNIAAMWGARRIGMLREGRMISFLDVGGERRDHDLWAITADRIPPGGLGPAMIEVVAQSRRGRAHPTSSPEHPAAPTVPAATE
jgi:RimJ/RimL family protein N-acetyltransferase